MVRTRTLLYAYDMSGLCESRFTLMNSADYERNRFLLLTTIRLVRALKRPGGVCLPYAQFSVRRSFLKCSGMARVNEGRITHFYTFIHEWNEPPCLYSTAAVHHRTLAGTQFPSHRE